MRAILPELTEKQKTAWPEAVAEAQRHVDIEDLPDQIDHPWWSVRVQHEQRPGRGHDLDAIFMSGDYAVSIHLGVYGETSVAVASLDMLHNSADEECQCEPCIGERAEDAERHGEDVDDYSMCICGQDANHTDRTL